MKKDYSKYRSNFIMQAGILAVAGIIVRIIGLLYRAPLTAVIGDEGNGYYSFAYNIYTNILLISSYSIPSAISKIMSQKLALKEYKNTQRIFKCALIYVTVVGGIAAAFAYFAAGILVVDNAVPVLRIFAPTIFLSDFSVNRTCKRHTNTAQRLFTLHFSKDLVIRQSRLCAMANPS